MLVGGCLWLGATSAQAQKPKLVVMDFAGNDGGKARAQVVRGLQDKATFETRSAAKKVLAAEGLKVSSVAGRAAIAKTLGVDYVVWGRVRGRGSAARAQIRIAGPRGKEITSRDAGPPGEATLRTA
jgi:TolB-like protein